MAAQRSIITTELSLLFLVTLQCSIGYYEEELRCSSPETKGTEGLPVIHQTGYTRHYCPHLRRRFD
ncbi:hypothetical protein EYF80_011707 [Liparis tanakae]|uniref:Secreted protein n=1 Tax=Liparis tanakae TaxID=230148 RepID=A0A4Z2IJJ1_9TELE|nr:hypothetical protein EYF80_011707 [Liparis tanakae]